ncbi:MAG: hypothetical protein AAGB93_18455 [Planctomycetota bacterium]
MSGLEVQDQEFDGHTASIGPLPAGTYRVEVHGFQVLPVTVDLAIAAGEATDVEVDLIPGRLASFEVGHEPKRLRPSSLEVRILDRDGVEVERRTRLWPGRLAGGPHWLDEGPLPVGSYTLEVRDDHGRVGRVEFEVDGRDPANDEFVPIPLTLRAP